MRTLQLLLSILVVAAVVACNRSEPDPRTERAAEQVKAAAAKAGHQLADSWLTTKIQAQFFADDDIKARHINVSTRDRVVTLTGYVESGAQRELATQIARTTDGVQRVNDQLTLTGQQQQPGAVATTGTAPEATTPGGAAPTADDAVVTARVQSKFFVDERVKGRRIEVDTRGGVVTLSGEVADEEERAQALLLARTTQGVTRVEDHLVIAAVAPAEAPSANQPAATIDDATLTTTIQAKYFVDPVVKESAINVTATNGVITLEGSVLNGAARQQALTIARNTPGVSQVVDRLSVAPSGR